MKEGIIPVDILACHTTVEYIRMVAAQPVTKSECPVKIQNKFILAVKKFCEEGYEVQAVELDIGISEKNDTNMMIQARKYRVFFENMKKLQEEGYAITGITVWGLDDKLSWHSGEYALLFDENINPKEAYLGTMLDPFVQGSE